MKEILLDYSFYFFIYGFLGWISEVVYTGIGKKGHFVNRGFLFSPFLPIYAFGAVFLIALLSDLTSKPLMLFIVAFLATTLLEYITALTLEHAFHVKWWDYSKVRFNIQGRVCLRNSLLFGLLSVFVMYVIQPPVETLLNSIDFSIKEILVRIFYIALITDIYLTLRKLNKIKYRSMENMTGKSKEAQLPDLINGKYSSDRISNFALNILLTISIVVGIIFMFLINIDLGLIISIIFFLILYITFKNNWVNNKNKQIK